MFSGEIEEKSLRHVAMVAKCLDHSNISVV